MTLAIIPWQQPNLRQSERRAESVTILMTIFQGLMNSAHTLFIFHDNRKRLFLISRQERA